MYIKYPDVSITLFDADGKPNEYVILDDYRRKGKQYLVLTLKSEIERPSVEIVFVEVSKNSNGRWVVSEVGDSMYYLLYDCYMGEDVDDGDDEQYKYEKYSIEDLFDEKFYSGEYYSCSMMDDDGNDYQFVIIGTVIYMGQKYHILAPAIIDGKSITFENIEDEIDPVTVSVAIMKVVDYEKPIDEPEFGKNWKMPDSKTIQLFISKYEEQILDIVK